MGTNEKILKEIVEEFNRWIKDVERDSWGDCTHDADSLIWYEGKTDTPYASPKMEEWFKKTIDKTMKKEGEIKCA